ncbi:MAG: fumarate hydratase [Candidatus Methylomirabilales bacterium]
MNRSVDMKLVEETARDLYLRALKILPPDVKEALRRALTRETHPGARKILETMLKNVDVAEGRDLLVCQDTGTPIYQARIGEGIAVSGVRLVEAIREGVRRATAEHPLRSSICHPITRENPQTNTGVRIPVIDIEFVEGTECLELKMMPKGSGSENMSFMRMLVPADGLKGVKRFVLESVVAARGMCCPPTVIGVGIGGTSDLVMKLAKEATWRPIGSANPDPAIAHLEEEMLEAVNMTGIGPMGLGGDTTTLAVQVEYAYTHITQNPVGVCIQCWRGERASARIYPDGHVEHGF